MRKVLRFFIEFQRKHFDWKLYLSLSVFLGICLIVNYWLDFENTYIDESYGSIWQIPVMFIWQGAPFLLVCFLLYAHGTNREWLKSRNFWIRFFIGFGILAFDRSFHYHNYLNEVLSGVDFRYIKKCVRWSSSLFTLVLPMLILARYLEPDRPGQLYGLAMRKFDLIPYLQMLGIAVVFIAIGSFFGDIQEYYPRYQKSYGGLFAEKHGLSNWGPMILYEICYASDFLGVEVMFRGFLIYAFTRTLGGYAVLPMIASYCFLHFGKPWPEAFSSIFGGYVLGIIAFRTGKVWGGVLIHIGVAWAMELFGYLQRLI